MNISQLIEFLENTGSLETDHQITQFEELIGARLPDEYRQFLKSCNGGQVGKDFLDSLSFDENIGIRWFGGFRNEYSLSLEQHRDRYQCSTPAPIPLDLIWIGSDVFGNAICLGIHGLHRGKVFFWDHEYQPDPDVWDGSVEMSENIWDVTDSFQDFVKQLRTDAEMEAIGPFLALEWKGAATLPNGRKFIADASFLIDLQYLEINPKLEKMIPLEEIERLLVIETTACFHLDELRQVHPSGRFETPNGIQLNKKYIHLLQYITTKDVLYLRTSTPQSAVIFCDGEKIIGALMPMKPN